MVYPDLLGQTQSILKFISLFILIFQAVVEVSLSR